MEQQNKRLAPQLYYDKELKKHTMDTEGFMYMRKDLLFKIMQECTLNENKYLTYLLSQSGDGSFRVATKKLLEDTGIPNKPALARVRKSLIERGWISVQEGKYIRVNLDVILGIEAETGYQNDNHEEDDGYQNDNSDEKGYQNDNLIKVDGYQNDNLSAAKDTIPVYKCEEEVFKFKQKLWS